jgi:uncharacterized LabA/DUF88 family protein
MSKPINRVLFVDGSNLFGGMSEVLKYGEYFEFKSFIECVKEDFEVDKIMFYATYMIEDKNKSAKHQLQAKAQIEFLNQVKSIQNIYFYKGHFSGHGKEKGVDVHLALDLAVGAIKNQFNEAIIMTGDADLQYAIEIVQKEGKKIHLAAFGTRFPYGISFRANKRIVYDYDDVFKDKLLPKFSPKPKYLIIRNIKDKVNVLKI